MHPDDVPAFIKNYTADDERFIRFDWNGELAAIQEIIARVGPAV